MRPWPARWWFPCASRLTTSPDLLTLGRDGQHRPAGTVPSGGSIPERPGAAGTSLPQTGDGAGAGTAAHRPWPAGGLGRGPGRQPADSPDPLAAAARLGAGQAAAALGAARPSQPLPQPAAPTAHPPLAASRRDPRARSALALLFSRAPGLGGLAAPGQGSQPAPARGLVALRPGGPGQHHGRPGSGLPARDRTRAFDEGQGQTAHGLAARISGRTP